ncbi:MAG: phosphoenolpyruvate carboxykinase (ATP) [Anaerolineaceae bacterium]
MIPDEVTSEQKLQAELAKLGITRPGELCFDANRAEIVEEAVKNGEGRLSASGAFVVDTSPYTGRSPNDKYLVHNGDPDLWFASGTQAIDLQKYTALKAKVTAYLQNRKLYVRDITAGADPAQKARLRVITDQAWQNLAAANMFIPPADAAPFVDPDLTVIAATGFAGDPETDGLRSPTFVIMNFDEKIVLIGNTSYAGEIKKSVFTYMNYVLPKRGVLSLHCSANKSSQGETALFFGLSGTGKTTLSSDPERALIGDDEHGWGEDGIFNFEGGCYAKTIRINPDYEPLVWSAINRFGTLIENVPLDAKRVPDFDSSEITENTRAAYPLHYIPNYEASGMGGHPEHIFFLTADAFGVLPPLAQLDTDQAMYYFLSGYTSKLAGTERGLGEKPEATFSTCFGAPFLPLKPAIYANLLAKKLEKHHTRVWLLNTGWSGGGFGIGKRIALPLTRAMISAVLQGSLNEAPTHEHPIFRVSIPDEVAGVPQNVLNPEQSWADQQAYAREALGLAEKFAENFKKYKASVPESVAASGPVQP